MLWSVQTTWNCIPTLKIFVFFGGCKITTSHRARSPLAGVVSISKSLFSGRALCCVWLRRQSGAFCRVLLRAAPIGFTCIWLSRYGHDGMILTPAHLLHASSVQVVSARMPWLFLFFRWPFVNLWIRDLMTRSESVRKHWKHVVVMIPRTFGTSCGVNFPSTRSDICFQKWRTNMKWIIR